MVLFIGLVTFCQLHTFNCRIVGLAWPWYAIIWQIFSVSHLRNTHIQLIIVYINSVCIEICFKIWSRFLSYLFNSFLFGTFLFIQITKRDFSGLYFAEASASFFIHAFDSCVFIFSEKKRERAGCIIVYLLYLFICVRAHSLTPVFMTFTQCVVEQFK